MRSSRVLREIREMRADHGELLSELREVVRFNSEVIRRNELAFRETVAELRELRAESKAHTRAIFALIDRLEGGTASAG